jgi:hypothetical protein
MRKSQEFLNRLGDAEAAFSPSSLGASAEDQLLSAVLEGHRTEAPLYASEETWALLLGELSLHRHSKLRLNPSIAASFSFKIWRLGDIHSARSECSQVKLDIRWEFLSRIVRDPKAPADFASVLICKLGQKLVLAMEGRINKQMPASFNVVSYSSENIEMVYCHQSPLIFIYL